MTWWRPSSLAHGDWGVSLCFLDFMASVKVLSHNESGLLAQKNRETNIKLTTHLMSPSQPSVRTTCWILCRGQGLYSSEVQDLCSLVCRSITDILIHLAQGLQHANINMRKFSKWVWLEEEGLHHISTTWVFKTYERWSPASAIHTVILANAVVKINVFGFFLFFLQ